MTSARKQSGEAIGAEGLYIERAADTELPLGLLQGKFCYILGPHQIGKTSLRRRTQERLRDSGVRCAGVTLPRGETDVTAERWYFGIAQQIAKSLGLAEDPADFWQHHYRLAPARRWAKYLREQIVVGWAEPVVVFVDAVEAALSVPFPPDDLFATIRALYDARAEDASLKRLTFCVLGVASPTELIRDLPRSPFRMGRSIPLEDFTRDQLNGFMAAFPNAEGDARPLLDTAFEWLNGHPSMSHRVFELLGKEYAAGAVIDVANVDSIAEEVFIRPGQIGDDHLELIERGFSRTGAGAKGRQMLELYRRLRNDEPIPSDPSDPVQAALYLTGLAAPQVEDGSFRMQLRNRVYARIFDDAWILDREAEHTFTEASARWIKSGQSSEAVIRGPNILEALDWAAERSDLSVDECRFLLAGGHLALEEQRRIAEIDRRERAEILAQSQLLHQTAAQERAATERTANETKALVEGQERRNRLLRRVMAVVLLLAAIGFAQAWFARSARIKARYLELAERGAKAALLAEIPGREIDSLVEGIRAVGPSLRNGNLVPPEAIEGLTDGIRAMQHSRPLMGHISPIRALSLSSDGTRLLTASEENARIWDVASGRALATLPMSSSISSARLGCDGVRPIVAYQDGRAQIFDADGKGVVAVLEGHHDTVWSLDCTSDGTRVATASRDGSARIWSTADGKALATLSAGPSPMLVATFSGDGAHLVTGSEDGAARLWDAQTGREISTYRGHARPVRFASFSHDDTRVLTGSDDKTAKMWSVSDGDVMITLEGHAGAITSAVFSPDDSQILTSSEDGTAKLWQTETGTLVHTLQGHLAPVRMAAFSPDGATVVTAGDDGTVRLWNVMDGRLTATLEGHSGPVDRVLFFQDGSSLVSSGHDGSARIWDLRADPALVTLRNPTGAAFNSAAFSPDGSMLVSSSDDRTARLWKARRGQTLVALHGHTGAVRAAVFSPDGRLVLTGSEDHTARLWSVEGVPLATLEGHGDTVRSVAFSPDGKLLLTGSDDGSARLWSIGSNSYATRMPSDSAPSWKLETLRTFRDPPSGAGIGTVHGAGVPWTPVADAVFSPDGQEIAVAGAGDIVHLWKLQGDPLPRTLVGHPGPVQSVEFSPNGARMLTGAPEGTVSLWDVGERRTLGVLPGHGSQLWRASYSPDGSRVATAGEDGLVVLWDAAELKKIASIRAHKGAARGAGFSPDGKRIVSAGADGTLKIWPATAEGYLEEACDLLRYQPIFDEVRATCSASLNRGR